MITKFEFFKLNESPDHIDNYKGNYLTVTDFDAVGFTVKTNKEQTKVKTITISKAGEYHSGYHSYPGRLWLNSKVITFWVYPNPVMFKEIIKKLEEELQIRIFNNDWKVEIIRNDEGEIKIRKVRPGADYKYSDINYWENSEFIPVEEYVGSEDFSDLQKQMHLMGWAEKQRLKEKGIKLAPGFGSDRTAWDKPRNLKYRQTIYQEKKSN